MRTLALTTLSTLLLAGAAAAQTGPTPMGPPGPTLATPDYLTAAGQSDQFEIQEGKLAQKLGKSPRVKSFGAMMVTEHTKTTAALMRAVKDSGMTPPPPPPLRPDQQAMIDELGTKSGDEFDRTYVSQQLPAHQEALSVQTGYAAGGSEPKIKAAAARTAPIVQSHINALKTMQSKMGS